MQKAKNSQDTLKEERDGWNYSKRDSLEQYFIGTRISKWTKEAEQSPETDPHKWRLGICLKWHYRAWGKGDLSKKSRWEHWISIEGKGNWPLPTVYHMNISVPSWTANLNRKSKMLEILESKSHNLRVRILNYVTKAIKMGFIKNWRITFKRLKRQWEEWLDTYIIDKGFISQICKERICIP